MSKIKYTRHSEGRTETWEVDVKKLPAPVLGKLFIAAMSVSVAYGNCQIETDDESSFDELTAACDLVESYSIRIKNDCG